MRRVRTTKRPGYREAVEWIAQNDNPGDGDSQEEVASYITVGFVADLFGADQDLVAEDVVRARRKAGIKVRADGADRWS